MARFLRLSLPAGAFRAPSAGRGGRRGSSRNGGGVQKNAGARVASRPFARAGSRGRHASTRGEAARLVEQLCARQQAQRRPRTCSRLACCRPAACRSQRLAGAGLRKAHVTGAHSPSIALLRDSRTARLQGGRGARRAARRCCERKRALRGAHPVAIVCSARGAQSSAAGAALTWRGEPSQRHAGSWPAWWAWSGQGQPQKTFPCFSCREPGPSQKGSRCQGSKAGRNLNNN